VNRNLVEVGVGVMSTEIAFWFPSVERLESGDIRISCETHDLSIVLAVVAAEYLCQSLGEVLDAEEKE
jgi:hypothetical protein